MKAPKGWKVEVETVDGRDHSYLTRGAYRIDKRRTALRTTWELRTPDAILVFDILRDAVAYADGLGKLPSRF